MEQFRIYDSLDSTNREALRLLASEQNLNGTVILAHHQTNGRGQYGRSWYAAPGSHLAMSIIMQPDSMLLGDLPPLGMKVSLAVARTIQSFEPSLHPLIKWPNDIYIGDRKLAGILIENSISSSRVQHTIIGIGMNVNESHFPIDVPNPVSLKMLTGREYDITSIATEMREQVMKSMDESFNVWKPAYDQLIFGFGKHHNFKLNENRLTAKVVGIDSDGRILLETEDNELKSYFSHEIKWLI